MCCLGQYFASSDYSIETTSRPRVQREKKTIYLQALYHKNIWYFVLCITIGIPAIMSSYVFFLVEERVAKTKEMQLIRSDTRFLRLHVRKTVFSLVLVWCLYSCSCIHIHAKQPFGVSRILIYDTLQETYESRQLL